jgi:peroxiredoxin
MPYLQVFATPDLARRRTLLAMLGIGGLATGCDRRQAAPEFAYTLLDGTRAAGSGLRGKVLLVNFWATSCATCVAEMPAIVATHQKFNARGYETLAVAMQYDAPARVVGFAESRRLPFGVVIDNTGAVARAFGDVALTPTSFLIDRRGAIAWHGVGAPDFAALHTRVEKLLAEA